MVTLCVRMCVCVYTCVCIRIFMLWNLAIALSDSDILLNLLILTTLLSFSFSSYIVSHLFYTLKNNWICSGNPLTIDVWEKRSREIKVVPLWRFCPFFSLSGTVGKYQKTCQLMIFQKVAPFSVDHNKSLNPHIVPFESVGKILVLLSWLGETH